MSDPRQDIAPTVCMHRWKGDTCVWCGVTWQELGAKPNGARGTPDDDRPLDPRAFTPTTWREDVLTPLARLGLWALTEMREYAGDLDGYDVQEHAEAFGVVKAVPAPKPCGDDCPCAEYEAEVCYRDTKATEDARKILGAVAATSPDTAVVDGRDDSSKGTLDETPQP